MTPEIFDTVTDWRNTLGPWRRILHGKLTLSIPTVISVAPTREDLTELVLQLSINRVGHDRSAWFLVLETLELLHWLFQLDAHVCWTILLEACTESIDTLMFPVAWLEQISPTYVLRVIEDDLLNEFDLVTDIFDVMALGLAEWNHSPQFYDMEAALLRIVLPDACGRRPSWISVKWDFVFQDAPPEEIDERLECLDSIKRLAAFLWTYQEPMEPRFWDDSAFGITSFGLDFGDCYLLTNELSHVTDTMLTFPVSSLTFSTWHNQSTPPSLVKEFCMHGVASVVTHTNVSGGLQSLTVCTTEISMIDRIVLAHAIATSRVLQQVTFFDSRCDTRAHGWLELMLDTLFGDDTNSQVHSVHLGLSNITAFDMGMVQVFFEKKHIIANRGNTEAVTQSMQVHGTEVVPIEQYRFSVHDLTTSGSILHTDQQWGRVFPLSSSTNTPVRVVMPKPAPHRLLLHRVRNLTISLHPEESGNSTSTEAVTLIWLVGAPLLRLSLRGPTDCHRPRLLLTSIQLERLLTACPDLVRLELHDLDIESLKPLTDPSLGEHLRSLVIDRCHIRDTKSIQAFYFALADPTHALHCSLDDLTMCEDDKGDIESVNAALDMLFGNDHLERFVLRGPSNGSAFKLRHCFQNFHHQCLRDAQPIALEAKLAFLSVYSFLFDMFNDSTNTKRVISTRIFEFTASPVYRHCIVVPV